MKRQTQTYVNIFLLILLLIVGPAMFYVGVHASGDDANNSLNWNFNQLLSSSQIVFQSGFEDGFNSWTSTNGYQSPVIVSSPVYSGSYAMQCSDVYTSQAIISNPNFGSMHNLFAEAEFRLDKALVGSEALIAYFDPTGNPIATVGLSNINNQLFETVEVYQPSYPDHVYSQFEITSQLQSNTWFSVALSLTTTSCTAYFNDQPSPTININSAAPTIKSVAVGMFYGTGTYGVYTGNLYVDKVQIGTLTSTPTPTPTSNSSPTPTPTATLPGSTPTPTPSTTPLPTNSNPISINRLPESLEVGGPAISILAALGLVLANPQFFGRTKW